MGAFSSRQSSREEEVDTSSNISYKYPPKSGNYFGSHFIMGGEKFDTPQPEAYLFGENADLNFLGNKPTPFPYPPPQSNEPYKTLKALVNIRKESLRFVKVSNDSPQQAYNIEFIFDCDVPCSITIHFFATEDTTNNIVSYIPKNPSCAPSSKSFHYKKGASQLFSQPSVTFTPSHYDDEELIYNMDKEVIPIVIHCVTVSDDGQEDSKQSHTSIAVVDHHADGCYTLKGLKQKLYVDGLCYLLQEIYGIENKNNDTYKGCEDCEDGGSECVICMCDIRDTLILPCRHLCLCYSCADSLRYQANNCPICRAPFRALLQIRALQKNSGLVSETSSDNIPSGYDAISLIEALNGPCAVRHPPLVVSLDPLAENPDHQTAGQLLNRRASGERGKKSGGGGGDEKGGGVGTTGSIAAAEVNGAAPEIRMSALLASSQDLSPTSTSDLSTSEHPPPISSSTQKFSASSSSCSPPLSCSTRKTAPLRRDKSLLRPSTLTTAAAAVAVQKRHSVDGNETPDDDSEAEKLSPLLDAGTSTELDSHDISTTPDYYGTKPVVASGATADLAEYYGVTKSSGVITDTDLAEYYGTNTKSKKHHQQQDLADFYGTNNTIAVKSAKQQQQQKTRSPIDDDDVENGMGEYFGSDMQLQVEIVGSPTSPDVRTTITQAGCGGSTVDTVVQGVQPVVSGGNNVLMGSNNGIVTGSGSNLLGSVVTTGDESDYYTPDEPCTTILSPVQESVESQTQPKHSATSHASTTENSGIGGTPVLKNNNWNTSLPGTPLSTASHRSSGDSYSSSSSTKQLLTYENSTLT